MLVNKKLLNYDFETYRLSLKKLKLIEKKLTSGLFDMGIQEKLNNFQKVKALGTYNHLFIDPFNQNSVYFVSQNFEVIRIKCSDKNENIDEPVIVYDLSNQESEMDTDSSINLVHAKIEFPTTYHAVIYDGKGNCHLVFTPDRCGYNCDGDNSKRWMVLSTMKISSSDDLYPIALEFRMELLNVSDSTIIKNENLSNLKLHGLFLNIHSVEHKLNKKSCSISWIIWQYDTNSKCMVESKNDEWLGETSPEMVTISSDYQGLHFISDHSYRYINPIINWNNLNDNNTKSLASWCHDGSNEQIIEFYIPTCPSNVNITAKYELKSDEKGEETHLLIINIDNYQNQSIQLYSDCVPNIFDLSNIQNNVEDNILSIKIPKLKETSQNDEFDADDAKMETNQIEDVDNCSDTNLALITFDLNGKLLEEINISSNEWLFSIRLKPNNPLFACIRQDVDALLFYKPGINSPWIHKHTLNAFGYITASKQERKYLSCSLISPLLSSQNVDDDDTNCIDLALVGDWSRDLHIYCQNRRLPPTSEMTVINRGSGRITTTVADQYFVSMKQSQQIMGVCINCDGRIFVLYTLLTNLNSTNLKNNQLGIALIDCC